MLKRRGVLVVLGATEETYPFQHHLLVVPPLHEQDDLPAGVAVDRVHLKTGRRESVTHGRPRERLARGNEDKRSTGVEVF